MLIVRNYKHNSYIQDLQNIRNAYLYIVKTDKNFTIIKNRYGVNITLPISFLDSVIKIYLHIEQGTILPLEEYTKEEVLLFFLVFPEVLKYKQILV